MKIYVFVMQGCPYTHSVVDMLKKFPHEVVSLFPPHIDITVNKKIPVHFVVYPQQNREIREMTRRFGIGDIASFPTIVKVDRNKGVIFRGNRTKSAFMRFLLH